MYSKINTVFFLSSDPNDKINTKFSLLLLHVCNVLLKNLYFLIKKLASTCCKVIRVDNAYNHIQVRPDDNK